MMAAVCLCVMVSGCIVVDDFAGNWEKGFIDICANDLMNNGDIRGARRLRAKTSLMRSLRVGDHGFLMTREHENDKGGNLIRYAVRDGEFVTYRLNESRREDFKRQYPDSGVVITSETATIPVLDARALALLESVAADESYWVDSRRERYNPSGRTDCIQTVF